jgi:sortase A
MRVSLPGQSVKKILRCTQLVLLAVAVGTLGYCALVWTNAWRFEKEVDLKLDGRRIQSVAVAGPGEMVGRMEIPRLGLSVAIAEGTGEATLRRAAGHIEGTALPGVIGNAGIAGHRDTLFRPLKDIQEDDVIVVNTLRGEYRYRVVSTRIVQPTDVAVLNPDGREVLTLVTCYPFTFIGAAPNRFIVRAERVPGHV